jgi:Tfp pilus assembly protein PilF
MTAGDISSKRDVIPRWRSVRRTIAAGEFRKLSHRRPLSDEFLKSLSRAERRWSEEGSQIAASELVGVSMLAGEGYVVPDAEQFLSREGITPQLRRLGRRSLRNDNDEKVTVQTASNQRTVIDQIRQRIREEKPRLIADPRNAIAWSDLARRYTMLGQLDKAERALKTALHMAPTSRYLHRVATWFYVHADRADEAYRLLGNFSRTQEDPWLMSAFIAVANVGELKVQGIKAARRLLESGEFSPRETSELVSELATITLNGGGDRRARKLFEQSLESPTDNSLAQVEWASHQLTQLEVDPEEADVPFKSEAMALSATQEGDWEGARRYSSEWLDDQPFETRAAVHASYIASVGLEDWRDAISYADIGLRARPGHPMLTNNLAYALIEDGQLERATQVLGGLDLSDYGGGDLIAILATMGLLAFRSGNSVEGESLYRRSIELARRDRNARQEAIARAMLLREVIELGREGMTLESELRLLHELLPAVRDNKGVLLVIRRAILPISEQFGPIDA